MEESEKLWRDWDIRFAQTILGDIPVPHDDTIRTGCVASREAYKQALREEIEKRRKQLQKEQLSPIKGRSDRSFAIENRLRELQIVEDFIDQVKPPKQ